MAGTFLTLCRRHAGVAVTIAVVVAAGALFLRGARQNYLSLLRASLESEVFNVRYEAADVGGRADLSRPAVGYLRRLEAPAEGAGRVDCGQVLLAPRLAVTAAACVGGAGGPWVVGYGPAPLGARGVPLDAEVKVVAVQRAPGGQQTSGREVAALWLDHEPPGVAPATLAPLPAGPVEGRRLETRVYGNDPSTGQRRGFELLARLEKTGRGIGDLVATGVDAGACRGDLGAGVLDPSTGALVALVSAHAYERAGTYPCRMRTEDIAGNCPLFRCSMRLDFSLVALSGYQAWIEEEARQAGLAR